MLSGLRRFARERFGRRSDVFEPEAASSAEVVMPYMDELKNAYDASPMLPSFLLANGDPLLIDLTDSGRLSEVLIRLPTEECLHLHSIQILDSDGNATDLSQRAVVTASSHYGDSADRLRGGKLFDVDGEHRWAVHTKREESPWIRLSLSTPVASPGLLVVRNRKDVYARRAVRLEVHSTADGQQWNELHRVEDAFTSAADEIARRHGIDDLDAGLITRSFAIAMVRGDEGAARGFFRRLPSDQKRLLRAVTNDVVLAGEELEWTSHGACRSLRFWSAEGKTSYVQFGLEVIDDLEELSPDVCFGFGSVLGPVRDADLIAHDDDIDVIVGLHRRQAERISDARRLVKEHLESKGYRVSGDFFAHWHVVRRDFKIDVFVGLYEEDGTIGWYPGTRGALTRRVLFPARRVRLFGTDYPLPRRPKKYLETIYSKQWRNPDPAWDHAWDPSQYGDIA